ncbi:MAG: rhodanese-like domain-containing protein [Campylobacterota bacterium]|nr:rhodanese-like domain-containing protein [Campylobacterota bacterium]
MNKTIKSIALSTALLATGMVFTGCTPQGGVDTPKAKMAKHVEFKTINFAEALKLQESNGALFLDARPAKLYKKATVMGALHMNVKQFDKFKRYLPADKTTPLVSFCNGPKCHLSGKLAKKLKALGYTNIVVYSGGGPEYAKNNKAMGLKKECKAAKAAGAYKPELPAINVAGVNIHLLAEDGAANEDGLIDQFWLAEHIKNNTVPKSITIVDVREPARYNESHIKNAINIPLANDKIDSSKLPKDGIVVFYCNTGLKSTDARTSIKDANTLDRVFIFDVTYSCDKNNAKKCTINPNEPL